MKVENNKRKYITPHVLVYSIETVQILVGTSNASSEKLENENYEW